MPPPEAMSSTTFYVVIQLFALPWAVIFGIVLDRIDRLIWLAIGMTVAFVGYASLGMLENPLSNAMYFAAAFVGAGEMAANISATSLIGKEASERGRGAVLGLFSLFGAIGIMVVGVVVGWLFDNWKPVGPFLYMAASNATLFLITLLARCFYAQDRSYGLKILSPDAGRWSGLQSAIVRASAP